MQRRAILHKFYHNSRIHHPNKRNLFFGTTTVTTVSILNAITARVVAFRNRRRIANVRRQLGYREMLDLGIYRGHVDRVASAENEAI
ncbi:hypothetical protein GCM10007874_65090 [Labrys miyagiensis]|uniref:DUF1127 domain-containing protein n=1 Tax=Labrys miyagiensis TaxID=346912 RepID=A0ABQ6CT48_9HYPH|nr:hypothetical protein GCM10007874_65090 [Labrys miyagiensis]